MNKRNFMAIVAVAIMLMAPVAGAVDYSVSRTHLSTGEQVTTYTWVWAGNASGNWDSGVSVVASGYLMEAEFVSGVSYTKNSGTTNWAAGADVTVTNRYGVDLLQNIGANLNPATGVTSVRTPLLIDGTYPLLNQEPIGVHVRQAGSGTSPYGTVRLTIKE